MSARGRPALRPKRRRGLLSGMKSPSSKKKTPLWQWIVGVPVLVALFAGILVFLYITYLNPRLAQGTQTIRTEILERVEKTRPDGSIDLDASYFSVRVDGRELRLPARLPDWHSVAKGDSVNVEIGGLGTAAPIVYSWSRADAPAP